MRRTVETSHLFKIRSNDIVPNRTEEMIKVRYILSEYISIVTKVVNKTA